MAIDRIYMFSKQIYNSFMVFNCAKRGGEESGGDRDTLPPRHPTATLHRDTPPSRFFYNRLYRLINGITRLINCTARLIHGWGAPAGLPSH